MNEQIGYMRDLVNSYKETSEKMVECVDDLVIMSEREADRRNSLRDEIHKLECRDNTDLRDLNKEVLDICHDLGIINMVDPCNPSVQEIIKVIRFLAAKVK